LARKNCLVEKGIVIADKEIRLDDILRRFAGETEAQGDRFSRPDTNESEHRLFKRIEEVFFDQGLVMLRKWFWPDCRIACCVLTHDVDWFYYSPWHRAVFRRRTVPQLIRLAYSSFICRENFGNNVSEMVQMEKQKGLRSSFYFLPKYNRNFEEFTSALRMLREEQLFEVGLHGYYSHDDFDKLSSQKMTLEKHLGLELKGIRQHALNFVAPTTWEYEERAGFLYDLTFHFNEKFGFRAGMCFPYHPFSLAMKKRLRILEMPTSIIDYTILYRRLSEAKATEVIEEIEATVESFNGLLLTCFHNTYMNKETFPEIVKIYGQLLEDVCKKGYWIATAQECCQWWLEREKTHIVAEVENNQLVGRTSSLKVPVFIETPDGKKLTREFSATSFRIDLANT
jgi:peptidoglycan/xylan/chitin deacetylase (PgdA/CDA1 family)